MMRASAPPAGGGKKILTAVLIAANLLMLVIAILTIPPNLRRTAGRADVPDIFEPNLPAGENEPAAAGAYLSTAERPDLEDFLWYTEEVFYDGVPADAAIIDNVEYTTGGWKGLIIYDPDNDYGANALEFLNVDIAGTADELSVTLDWYLIFIAGEGESFDETDMEDIVYDGEWVGGGIRAFGLGEMLLRRFYDLNGKQYAFGTLDTPDGIPAFIALVRP